VERPSLKKSLSICCRDGVHEIALYQTGKVRKVCGFDISEGASARAMSKLNDAAVPPENYCFAVSDANNLTLKGYYDLILSLDPSWASNCVTTLARVARLRDRREEEKKAFVSLLRLATRACVEMFVKASLGARGVEGAKLA
jgi:Methyltransferase domain